MSHLEFSVAIRTIGLSTAIWMGKNCRKKWSWQKAVEEAVQLKAAIGSSVLIAPGKLGYLKLVGELFDKLVGAESIFEGVRESKVCVVG